MSRMLTVILIFLSAFIHAQEYRTGYNLARGDQYFIQMQLLQNTRTDAREFSGNASLDIRFSLHIEVVETPGETNNYYLFSCRYQSPALDFISPQRDITLSSSNREFSLIRQYLEPLEKAKFAIIMSASGDILSVSGIDSVLVRAEQPGSANIQTVELTKKVVREAFGSEALTGHLNAVLNVYGSEAAPRVEKQASITFNARLIPIANTFYFSGIDSEKFRIQGIGIVQSENLTFEFEGMNLSTAMQGNQTYDMVYNLETGWIINGISKQKINTLSKVSAMEGFPEGLQIPSYTESEYRFKGEKIVPQEETKGKVRGRK